MYSFGPLQIEQQLDDSETQSYLVVDRETKRKLLFHFLPDSRVPEARYVYARLESGLERRKDQVISRGYLLGLEWVVTELIPDFRSLNAWLSEPAELEPPGEFTRLFQSPTRPEKQVSKDSVKPGDFTKLFAPSKPDRAPEPSHEPGEFTRMLQSPSGVASKPTPSAASANSDSKFDLDETKGVEPRDLLGEEPGEARMRQRQHPSQASSSEFARKFQDPLGKGREIDFRKPVNEKPVQKEPGEFTRMFGNAFSQIRNRKTASSSQEAGGATRVFSKGNAELQHAPVSSVGPSEYTRFLQGGASPHSHAGEAPKESPAPPPTGASSKATPLLLFAVLGVLLLLAIALVLVLALRR